MSAALLIVGSEVLSGAIADANTPWLARLLTARGVDLMRVVVVPDDAADVAATARELRSRHHCLFISGGIGPTNDDVTYEAVGDAFGLALGLHEPTVARMRPYYASRGVELNAARLRMATLPLWPRGAAGGEGGAGSAGGAGGEPAPPPPPARPAGAEEVLFTDGLWVPLVKVAGEARWGPVLEGGPASAARAAGAYVLPGIPRLFQKMLQAHAPGRFAGPLAASADLFSSAGEGDVAEPLRAINERFPGVSVGSYCDVEDVAGGLPAVGAAAAAAAAGGGGGASGRRRVRLSFSSRDAGALAGAVEAARREVPGVVP